MDLIHTCSYLHTCPASTPAPPPPQPRQMGEDRGVARSSGVVSLESNTSRVGRKCDNPSCMKRDGLGGAAFKRCSVCK